MDDSRKSGGFCESRERRIISSCLCSVFARLVDELNVNKYETPGLFSGKVLRALKGPLGGTPEGSVACISFADIIHYFASPGKRAGGRGGGG